MNQASTHRRPATLLRPERLRVIERPFGWLPCRLLSDGWFESVSQPAKLLYPLLAMASDRQGLSFYSAPRIEQVLGLGVGELDQARNELSEADLLAFDGWTYQLLSLPHHCPPLASELQPRSTTRDPSASPSLELPDDVQAILHKLLGQP